MTTISTDAQGGLEAAWADLPEEAVLAAEWRALEARSGASFFQSWHWIGCLLATAERPARLLRVGVGGELQGLGLFFTARDGRRLTLHATGQPELDTVFVEYNGLLAARGREADVTGAALRHLCSGETEEIAFPGVWPALLEVASATDWLVRERSRMGSYAVDLAALEDGPHSYISKLGRSTRQQLRRALRLYQAHGPLRLDAAASLDEAFAFLERLERLHQQQWQARARRGAFARPYFGSFHRTLLRRSFADGAVELLRLTAGETELGYLYNFLHRDTVLYYQSGFAPPPDPRHKPGLVAHALAIERHRLAGRRRYDFMAGDHRYKASLGVRHAELVWFVLLRPNFRHRMLVLMDRAKKSWPSRS